MSITILTNIYSKYCPGLFRTEMVIQPKCNQLKFWRYRFIIHATSTSTLRQPLHCIALIRLHCQMMESRGFEELEMEETGPDFFLADLSGDFYTRKKFSDVVIYGNSDSRASRASLKSHVTLLASLSAFLQKLLRQHVHDESEDVVIILPETEMSTL